jgi:hypothetical protein
MSPVALAGQRAEGAGGLGGSAIVAEHLDAGWGFCSLAEDLHLDSEHHFMTFLS